MALNVYDPATGATTPTQAPQGWSFTNMLADPNFQLALANMGKAADPEGAGGVIGGAAANLISSKAAQTALEKREAARTKQINDLVDRLGGFTPKDQPGVTSLKRTPSGGVAFDLDLPPLDASSGIGAGTVLAPGVSGQQRTQPLTQAAANAVPAPALTPIPANQQAPVLTPIPAATQPAQPQYLRSGRQMDVLDLAPFY